MKKYMLPVAMLAIFETIAVTLWLTKDNLFYLFNFSYIGIAISLGIFLFVRNYKHTRRVTQLLVGLYMLVYLGLLCNENMQIEGFWYYLVLAMEAAVSALLDIFLADRYTDLRAKVLLSVWTERLFRFVCPAKLDHTCRCKSDHGNPSVYGKRYV